MLVSEFSPAGVAVGAARTAGRAYSGTSGLPAGIRPDSLRSTGRGQPVRVGQSANENFKGALPQNATAASEPMVLRPLAAAAGLAGTLGAAEFMGPVAGWGVRKTLGKLPGAAGEGARVIGSVPMAVVNTLYQTPFGAAFSAQGRKQAAANFWGTMHQYSTGAYVSSHGLSAAKELGSAEAAQQQFWANGAGKNGLPYLEGAVPKANSGFSLNPLKWFASEPAAEAGVERVVAENRFSDGLKSRALAHEGIVPKAFEAGTKAEGWGLEAIGSRIMHGRAMGVVMKGGLVAAVGLLGIKLTSHFREQVAQAQEIHSDLYGKDVSAWTLLMSPAALPPMMQQVRANLLEHVLPGTAQVVSEGLDKYGMADGLRGIHMMPIIAGQLIGMGVNAFKPNGEFLQTYSGIKTLQQSKQPVPAEAYAALMEAASAPLRVKGGAKMPLVQEMAAQYATEQMPVAQVLKEIEMKQPFSARAQAAAATLQAREQEAAAMKPQPAHDAPIMAAPPAPAQANETPSLKVGAMEHGAEHQGKLQQMQRQVGA